MSLTLSRSEFEVRFLSPMRMDDFSSAGWRSGLGKALRQQWCGDRHGTKCNNCSCPYAYTWNATKNCNAALHYTNATRPGIAGESVPKPYILNAVDMNTRSYAAGETTRVQLTLMGHIVQEWPEWALAFNALGERGIGKDYRAGKGRFEVVRVWDVDGVTPLTARTGMTLPRIIGLNDFARRHEELLAQGAAHQLTLFFLRPLRLNNDNGDGRFSFVDFWNTLVTRIKNLLCSCIDITLEETLEAQKEEFKMLAQLARNIEVVDQVLNPHEQKRSQRRDFPQERDESGWVGHVTLRSKTGDLTKFLYYLVIGEWVHVGHSCTMGNGAFRVVPGLN